MRIYKYKISDILHFNLSKSKFSIFSQLIHRTIVRIAIIKILFGIYLDLLKIVP